LWSIGGTGPGKQHRWKAAKEPGHTAAPQTVKSASTYYRGAVVRHAKFGIGTVQRSEGAGDDLKISVSFPGHGVKTLAVKYANLEMI
jgi:DNA helicase-2/ATP-dependent DNA helicase PcrA